MDSIEPDHDLNKSAMVAAVFCGGELGTELKATLAASPDTIPEAPLGERVRIDVCAFDDVAFRFKFFLNYLSSLFPLFPSARELVAVFEDREEGRIVFLPNPRDASRSRIIVTEFGHKHLPDSEITAEMIEAGTSVLLAELGGEDHRIGTGELARMVFAAMVSAGSKARHWPHRRSRVTR